MTAALITTTLLKYFDICFKLYIKLLRTEHIQNESVPFYSTWLVLMHFFLQIFLLFSLLASSFCTFCLLCFGSDCSFFASLCATITSTYQFLHSLCMANSIFDFLESQMNNETWRNHLLLILNSNCNQHLHFYFSW